MPAAPRAQVESAIAALLNRDDRSLPAALQDVGDELAFHLVMNPPLMAALERQARARRRPAGPALRAQLLALGRRSMSSRLRAMLTTGRRKR
jgi:hypothetical protein